MGRKLSHFLLGGSIAALSLAISTPASAQDDPDAATSAAAADQADAEASESEEGDNIIITAQRRAESLQNAALAISAVGGDDLVEAGVSDVTGLSKMVPSLVVQPSVGTATGFYLRGVGSFVGNAFTENPIAFNYGQVYLARPASLLGTFYDLERVEVLKGPQGTLYGRNATGGAINVIPRQPELGELGGSVLFEYGNYDSRRAQAAVNVPLGDRGAFRIAGQYSNHDAYMSDGYDDENGYAVRASVLVEPSDRVRAVFVGDYFHQGGNGAGSVLVPGALVPLAPDPDERIGGADPISGNVLRAANPLFANGLVLPPAQDGFVDSDFWGASANIDIDLGPATLTIVPAYRDSNPDYLTYNGGYQGRVTEESRQNSLEVRLASDSSTPLEYVIGGYYFGETQDASNEFTHGPILGTRFVVHQEIAASALFGQATYSVLDNFRLTAGARYTWEDRTNATTLTQRQFANSVTSSTTGSLDFQRFTYKLGFEFDAGPRNLIYGSYATGFKSGGFFIAALDNTFGPETLRAWTLGSRNQFFDNRLQLNVEAFYWQYRDQQVNFIGPIRTSATTIGAGLTTTNAGASRMYGVEVDLRFRPTPRDTISANVQYLNGKYTDFSYLAVSGNGSTPRSNCVVTPSTAITLPAPARPFLIDCSGRPQINSPDWTANFAYERTFRLSRMFNLQFMARTRIESARFLSAEYLPEMRQDSYMQSDAVLTLENHENDWSISAFFNNIEDETVYAGTSLRPVVPVVYNILRAPRTYGVRFTADF